MTTFQYNGHTYLLSTASTWTDAQTYAQSVGGNLVTINDQAEQDWLVSTFGTSQMLWIGYTDLQTEGVFKWVNGETSTYTHWDTNQPDNHGGNESYVALNAPQTTAGSWGDLPNALQGPQPLGIVEIGSINNAPTGTVTITGTPTQGQLLTAGNSLADADGLGTISYQWQAGGTAISGATANTYTLTQAEVGKTIVVIASYTDNQNNQESVSSSATASVANVNDLPSGTVTITGVAKQGEVLTAANNLADADGLGTISYQWLASGTAISGATAGTYTLTQAEVGKTITVTASYTDLLNSAESKTSSATVAVANINDLPTGAVTITGTATQGQTLTAGNTLADADGLGTVTYQWLANGVNVATGSSYTLTQAEVGKTMTVTAGYTDLLGSLESVSSSATGAVVNVNDLPTGAVIITGTVSQGQTLTVSNTLADADGLGTIGYQWQAGGLAISGATSNTYAPTQADVGKTITATATYTDGFAKHESVASAPTAAVANTNDLPTGTVTIIGIPMQGQTLIAGNTLADADGLGDITYKWQANGVNVGSGSSYTLTQAEVGKTITAVAVYSDDLGSADSKTSPATGVVSNINDLPAGAVIISGTARQGQTLTASNTLADADGLGTVSYQWLAGGTAIDGATGSTYTLTQAEVGKSITVAASYTDLLNTAESKTSSATAAVANSNDLPVGAVTISGTPAQGQTLTAGNSLTDADGLGTISYQWQAGGAAISGATAATYTLTQAEVDKTITVTASYTDSFGAAESKTSSATLAVANINDSPTGAVTITGTPAQGQMLTAGNTLADADGLGDVSYQWQANGVKVGVGSSYTLTQDDVGKTISAIAGYTDKQGAKESVASAATSTVLNVNDLPTGTVVIAGIAKQGEILTASNTLADSDGLGAVTYQWQANGLNIGTGDSYSLTSNEIGKTVTATATYTDGLGALESVTSAASAKVIPPTTPGFTILPLTLQATGEDGSSASYTLRLNTAPAVNQNVTVTFASSDTGEGVVDKAVFTFTSANYATPQTLTVSGVDDYSDDGDIPYEVTAKVGSIDISYKNLTIRPLNLTNIDDGLDIALDLYGDQGGFKSDVLVGGNGADVLQGLTMADDLSGGRGNDTVLGGYGNDNLFGNDGDDELDGEQGNDYLEGNAGNDSLDGGDGLDTLLGGEGNDTLDGGQGVDSMSGGEGNDTYYLGYDAVDVITDNGLATDRDTVIMPYQLSSYTLPDNIEIGTIAAGTEASSLTGNNSDNVLTGNDGNNVLSGEVGNDSLAGGSGNDDLLGGDGDDTVNGGIGNDLIVGGNGIGDDMYFGGAGIDTVKYTSAVSGIRVSLALGAASGKEIDNDQLNSIENVIGGQAGDTLNGDRRNNVLDGFTGNDTISGGAGRDTMVGGLGNDTYVVDNAGDVVTETSASATEIDTVNSSVAYALKANVENLTLSGAAKISASGNSLDNVLTGNKGANILSGGAGSDTLTGALGADQFKFNAESETGVTAETRDLIVDFSRSEGDKINLSAIDADIAFAGNNAFSAPTVGGTFSGMFSNPGELYFDKNAHILYGNNDADSTADFSIELAGVSALAAADFVL